MIVVTSSEIAGKRIVKTLGLVRGNTARAQERVISTGNANASKAFADQLAGRAASACPIAANKIKVKHSTPSLSVMAQRMDCRSPESSAQHSRTRS